MKLYNLKAGVNPRRVRIFLAEKGVDVELVDFDMDVGQHRQPDFMRKNPMATLPVLELPDGTILSESIAICRYVEETKPEPPLFGATTLERAQVEMWNRRMEHEILLPIINTFVHTHDYWVGRRPQVREFGELQRAHVQKRMEWLDGELKDRQHVAGDRYTVADITAQVAFLTAKGALQLPIPEAMPNLARWWKSVAARPSARA